MQEAVQWGQSLWRKLASPTIKKVGGLTSGERPHTHTGLAAVVSYGELHVWRKTEMEFGMQCWVPPTVHWGLKSFSNIFLIRLSRHCFLFQMLNLRSLLLEIWFDPTWRNNEISNAKYTDGTGNREPGRPVGESTAVNGNIHLLQREPDDKDDSVVSFFSSPVHVPHWHRPLPLWRYLITQ